MGPDQDGNAPTDLRLVIHRQVTPWSGIVASPAPARMTADRIRGKFLEIQ